MQSFGWAIAGGANSAVSVFQSVVRCFVGFFPYNICFTVIAPNHLYLRRYPLPSRSIVDQYHIKSFRCLKRFARTATNCLIHRTSWASLVLGKLSSFVIPATSHRSFLQEPGIRRLAEQIQCFVDNLHSVQNPG